MIYSLLSTSSENRGLVKKKLKANTPTTELIRLQTELLVITDASMTPRI